MNNVTEFGCAIIDLFGHAQIAGLLLRDDLCGVDLLRVDVPETLGRPGFTRYIGLKAIYSLTMVGHAAMHLAASQLRERAVTTYLIPESVANITRGGGQDAYEEDTTLEDDSDAEYD